jgi:hypothetical protein
MMAIVIEFEGKLIKHIFIDEFSYIELGVITRSDGVRERFSEHLSTSLTLSEITVEVTDREIQRSPG